MSYCLIIKKYPRIVDCMGQLQEITREILRNCKSECDVTRYKIAKETGISESNLSLFVNGKQNIGLDRAEILLNYLGYSIEVVKQESEAE
jgi:plasmid maintenance system antidote protein VapI